MRTIVVLFSCLVIVWTKSTGTTTTEYPPFDDDQEVTEWQPSYDKTYKKREISWSLNGQGLNLDQYGIPIWRNKQDTRRLEGQSGVGLSWNFDGSGLAKMGHPVVRAARGRLDYASDDTRSTAYAMANIYPGFSDQYGTGVNYNIYHSGRRNVNFAAHYLKTLQSNMENEDYKLTLNVYL